MADVTQTPEALAANLELIASQYDELPYNSLPFSRTHPLRLAAIARLFGLQAPAMANARVLELGCAAGGNIIPMAALYPSARFYGVDLGRRQVAEAQRRIASLGLTNIEIHCQSLTDLGEDIGEFDYIISHGVYSWVPRPVQEALLRATGKHLAPNGIGYVSYNVAPGWHLYKPLRDAFRLLIPEHHGPAVRVEMARELLTLMQEQSPDLGPYGDMLRASPSRFARLPSDYIFHEYMEDSNDPVTIRDFINDAENNGLVYLADSDLSYLLPENFGPQFARQIRERTSGDLVTIEQMVDVMTGRTFRSTLLAPRSQLPDIARGLSPKSIEDLHFLAGYGMTLERDGAKTTLMDAGGRTMTSTEAAVGPAIERLLARMPGTISFAECIAGFSEKDQKLVSDAIYKSVIAGILDIVAEPVVAGKPGNRPKAFAIARADAAEGNKTTVNIRHDAVSLDPLATALLPALDGATSRKELEKLLVDAALAGRIKLGKEGQVVTDARSLRLAAEDILPRSLGALEHSGLLLP
jgi:SAM-dependent methyltransferase